VRRPWLPVTVSWLAVTVALLAAWHAALHPGAIHELPSWFLRIARLTGTVVYDDPALAIRIQITRLVLIATAAAGTMIALLERRRLVRAITTLVNQKSDPLNLAIFRIVVFWQIYNIADVDFIARYAAFPTGLQYPPQTGLPRAGPLAAWALWPLHTVSPSVIAFGVAAMKGAAITAAVGLFSRTSAALVCFLFLFAWGRLQWYGKVDHQHHLLWFAALLAVSPCGDVLSLDALIARLRKLHKGRAHPPTPSRRYGMPLAFSMILIGIIYLFPGLWKASRSGLDWALSDNPKLLMQQEWRMYGDWLPILRFDEHAWLYHAGALGVLLFEMSFVFLLLGNRTRLIAALLGLGFHLNTNLTLNIPFATLRNCYVVFVDWCGLLRRMRLFPPNLHRVPAAGPDPPDVFPTATAMVGTLLIAGNLWAGAIRAMDGWPVACYPPFDGLAQPYTRNLRMVVMLKDNTNRFIMPDEYRNIFGNRWNNLLQRILTDREEQRRLRLQLVWQVISRTEAWPSDARYVRFYSVRRSLDPAHWRDEPDEPQLLYETAVGPGRP
jgi:vitamin K-dependent gamma-carboxylase-like protein